MKAILMNGADATNARTYFIEEGWALGCISYVRKHIFGTIAKEDIERGMGAVYLITNLRLKT
ncbi:MAG: hypothetical protein R8M14_00300 [Ghiorsea sp.]